MSATYAFGRLFWRPATVWSALVISGMAFGASLMYAGLRTSLPWFFPSPDALQNPRFHALGLLLVPLFAGMLVSDTLRSLEHCPFSFSLPGSQSGLRRSSAICGLVLGLLCGVAAGDSPGAVLVVTCTSVFWFALGLLLFDPGSRRWVTSSGVVLALAGFLGAEWYAWWLEGPLAVLALAIVSTVALAGAVFGFRLRFDDRSARARALLPSWALPMGMRPRARTATYSPRAMARVPAGRAWSIAAIGDRTSAWVRAALYEAYGARRGGWWGGVVIGCAVVAGVVLLIGFHEGYAIDSSWNRGLQYAWYGLAGRGADWAPRSTAEPPFGVIQAMVALGMLAAQVTTRRLHAGLSHPVGRRARARVAWGLALLANVGQALVLVLVLGLLTEGLRLATGAHDARFGFVLPVLVAVVTMPALQATIERVFPVGSERRSPLANMLLLGVLSVVYMIVVVTGVGLVEDLVREVGHAILLAGATLLFMLGQLAWRAWLERWYARCDLV